MEVRVAGVGVRVEDMKAPDHPGPARRRLSQGIARLAGDCPFPSPLRPFLTPSALSLNYLPPELVDDSELHVAVLVGRHRVEEVTRVGQPVSAYQTHTDTDIQASDVIRGMT